MRIELEQGPQWPLGFLAVTESIERLLDGTRLLSMATVGDNGVPWLHNAYFAYDADLHLYFLTRPDSEHARNLANSDGQVAVTVADTRQDGAPGTRQGLQLQGPCRPAEGDLLHRGAEVFGDRFPGFTAAVRRAARPDGPAHGSLDNPALRLFVFSAARVKIFDEPAWGRDVWLTGRVLREAAPQRTA
ncbi:pyridoxamine 5'-phosphate oxidase family protein [Actinacidiphila acidipaludis]|uniref:Pyridoxamine 5'-phosphate oxidase family protein n=1 Tax=Actinacidiphila acidipaludis TaxID=2873382 RepID=A0ABS7Q2A4_9ACTN|nr:pyridoxamine 5'-phosphate oxidase family protein [Streptomyces acidipaludis]MBY8877272.1 pyridoxamine 5'-phosphate oxidase family protein [Streptomyces acidipaludis]